MDLATWCEELTHWKWPWCWERLRVGGEGDNRGWDGWTISLTQWMWVLVNSGTWWWTGRPGVLQAMGLQRVRHDWATELNWTDDLKISLCIEKCMSLFIYAFNASFCYPATENNQDIFLSWFLYYCLHLLSTANGFSFGKSIQFPKLVL